MLVLLVQLDLQAFSRVCYGNQYIWLDMNSLELLRFQGYLP